MKTKLFILFSLNLWIWGSPSLMAQSKDIEKTHPYGILIDTHNDVLSEVSMKGRRIDQDLAGISQSDLARFKKGGVDVQIFSIFCDNRFGRDTAFKYANIEMDSLMATIQRNPSKMELVRNPRELKEAVQKGKLGCMMGVEGGHMIEDKIENLESFFSRGVRYMTLTWNNSTSWASSAMEETDGSLKNPKKGLNDFGKEIVRKMNDLGMIVDISHVGEQTFWDAIHTSRKPVIASHSCVYRLSPVYRNLKDDQIKAIAKNGGVIQINFYSAFLDSTYNRKMDGIAKNHPRELDSLQAKKSPIYEIRGYFSKKYPQEIQSIRPPLSLLIDHIDYIVKLVGIDYVGLGSDFDGIESAPIGLDGVLDFPKITQALLDRGYSVKDIQKIRGGNFLRVFEANSKK